VDGQQHVVMDGRPVFRWAVRLLDAIFPPLLDTAGVALADVDLWVPHQANARIIDAAASSLGIDRQKLVMHLDRYGNMSSASIPVALDEAVRAGQIERGMTIATAGFGAGLTWAAGVLRW
jgi:3-oxoacyl-[acyl-carrier-protein] synthase-3